jgi:hypothetical protein
MIHLNQWIKDGMQNAYSEQLKGINTDSIFRQKVFEYSFTESIKNSIIYAKQHIPFDFDISNEFGLGIFAQNAFFKCVDLKTNLNNPFEPSNLVLSRVPYYGNQRIDIGLIRKFQNGHFFEEDRSICGIEVKRIDPSLTTLISDLNRLIEVMNLKDKTGINSIENIYGVYGKALHKKNEELTQQQYSSRITKLDKRLNRIILNLCKPNNLKFEIEIFDIKKQTLEKYKELILTNDENSDIENDYEPVKNTGAIVGIVINIYK